MTRSLFSPVSTPVMLGKRVAVAVWPVVVLVLTGLNRIRTPSACTQGTTERKWENLGHRMVVLVIIHVREVDWIKVWHTHTRPFRSLHVYVEYLYEWTLLLHVVNSASHPSSNTLLLFVFTVALWDAIALPPVLPTVKQDYWGYPLLFSSTENYYKYKLIASTVAC